MRNIRRKFATTLFRQGGFRHIANDQQYGKVIITAFRAAGAHAIDPLAQSKLGGRFAGFHGVLNAGQPRGALIQRGCALAVHIAC